MIQKQEVISLSHGDGLVGCPTDPLVEGQALQVDVFFVLLKPVFSLFSRSCSFPLSFFLSQPLSTFKYHHLFKSFFLFFFSKHGALLVHIPPDIFFCFSFLFYSIIILVVLNYEL